MTEITLYNTQSRRKEKLAPLDPSNVRMYVCGPTVYDRAHIGNARAVVVFDVLYRLLRHEYGADHVTYVRNFTDVDDKINARAAATLLPGETEIEAIRRITDETIGWYHADMDALGALRPNHEPRATEYIAPMVAMIEALIATGHAYEVEGHVLFSVPSDPDYGKLSRRSVEDMRAGARVEVAPYKRDPMDFVLWKPSDATTPGWDSPWGQGRPGWHIECSAMAQDLLGESFDIHGGGIDLAFPHHENELAQSRCAHPHADYAKIWMHNGMLNIEGDKMSKSLGNFFTVRDLLDKGAPGEVIRFVLLSAHYTQPMDWTQSRVNEALRTLKRWHSLVENTHTSIAPATEAIEALADDLNTPLVITELYKLENDPALLLATAKLIGLLDPKMAGWYNQSFGGTAEMIVKRLAKMRQEARKTRNFELSDKIRDELAVVGISIIDNPNDSIIQRDIDLIALFGWLDSLDPDKKNEIIPGLASGVSVDTNLIVDAVIVAHLKPILEEVASSQNGPADQ